jgi:hypothetical protein
MTTGGFGNSQGTGGATQKDHCQAVCCKPDPMKCRGYDTGNIHKDQTCGGAGPYDQDFKDDHADYSILGMKMNNVVTSHATYKRQCCSAKLSCQNYKDGVVQPQPTDQPEAAAASAAKRQHEVVAAPVLLALGVFALSK